MSKGSKTSLPSPSRPDRPQAGAWLPFSSSRRAATAASHRREVWSEEARAYYQEADLPTPPRGGFYPVAKFYERLTAAVQQSAQSGAPLAILVLQVPPLPPTEGRWQRELEIALRLEVRRTDLPARLTPTTFAVALPDTGAGAAVMAARLEAVLAKVAKQPIVTGVAHYPDDGQTAGALLRVAAGRCLKARPGQSVDTALEQLLGPLPPGGRGARR